MKFEKNKIENLLNSFEWKYKEIYIEKSSRIALKLINWKIEAPTIWETSGFSVLSRNPSKEYFKAYSGLDNFEDEINSFVKVFWIEKQSLDKIVLNWERELFFEESKVNKDIEKLAKNLKDIKKLFCEKEIISSYVVNILFSKIDFIVANSNGNFTKDSNYYSSIYVILNWQKDWQNEEIFEKITWTWIHSTLDYKEIEKTSLNAIEKLEKVLNWKPSPSGIMDVVISNESGWTIIHEAIGHWLEADLLNSSVYKDKLWQKVAQENINIVDEPSLCNLRGSYEYDHEWNKSKKTYLIKSWILVSYLHSEKTAELFETDSTWHARREWYYCPTLVRMWNTYLEAWTDKKEKVISQIKNWIYVAQMWGWQVNTVTWDFVFKVNYWYLIEDWKLTDIIRWANISGNWPEMLNNIKAICDDLVHFDWWTCGKGQSMPVSDATPTIWTQLKVTWIK